MAHSRVQAPPAWRAIDFVSDLHLHASDPDTAGAFFRHLAATDADAVFILGDLFEVWVGDDAAHVPGFEADVCAELARYASRGALHVMHGNRDFLLGEAFAQQCHAILLDDPCMLEAFGQRWLLSHGDALCLGDRDYLRFRMQVRAPAWQSDFLRLPLAQRHAQARAMREASAAHQRESATFHDVDAQAARLALEQARASLLLHGHTHQPGEHDLGGGLRRVVLGDWDARATPPRLPLLRLTVDGWRRSDARGSRPIQDRQPGGTSARPDGAT